MKILITIEEGYEPRYKDAFEDVVAALNFFEIKAHAVVVKEAKEDN